MRTMHLVAPALLLAAGSMFSTQASAAGKIDCEMKFSLTGWSAIYKHAEGGGTVSCNNGRTFPVNIVAIGGGLTVGKYKIEGGTGKFLLRRNSGLKSLL